MRNLLSEPLIIDNPIKGETLAVFDRNYNKTLELHHISEEAEIKLNNRFFRGD